MDYKKVGAAGVLLTLLLSGCGTQAATQDTAKQANAAQSTASQDTAKQDVSQAAKQEKPAQMNEKEREMSFTFQSLLMMDKADGLAITKDQAASMLTVVQDSITKGELTSDAQTKLTEKLTAEQKKYMEDSAAKMKERMSNMKPGEGAGGAQRQGQGQRQAAGDGSATATPKASTDANGAAAGGQQAQGATGSQPGSADGSKPQDGKGGQGARGGKNAGQQLVELLQSKTK
ncbi:hypothetical protein [Paenibacillus rigui]|uniref:Lipoprotein n=1 Tax=Paenibacillus rigui TaxID=554312 RepID=A0A229UWS1_9BACL|nr:hypothetical protein [Paenibacillus rigui]OXM87595.1 hypothetical protein CF651_04535 [Paenibacillus rigui]